MCCDPGFSRTGLSKDANEFKPHWSLFGAALCLNEGIDRGTATTVVSSIKLRTRSTSNQEEKR